MPATPPATPTTHAVGVIGGSGLYALDGLEEMDEIAVETPFGPPSEKLVSGSFAGRQVYFLPRHGKGHRILPSELNHRANIWALRSLGVRWVISVTAVGSLRERYQPRDLVLPDQFFDRTSQRTAHTFFGNGIVAHVAFADPTSNSLRDIAAQAASDEDIRFHKGGTYVNMDGPAFSTRAESETNRKLGFDVIGMTNVPEAKLSREAEMAYTPLAFITDYDGWKQDEEPVTAEIVIGHLLANADTAKRLLRRMLPRIPAEPEWPEHRALESALITDRSLWPPETVERLRPLLARFL